MQSFCKFLLRQNCLKFFSVRISVENLAKNSQKKYLPSKRVPSECSQLNLVIYIFIREATTKLVDNYLLEEDEETLREKEG